MRDRSARAGRVFDGVAPRTRLLALLERNEGASVAELAEGTGWQPHSVRAALSRLRQRGVPVERLGHPGRTCRYRIKVADRPSGPGGKDEG